MQTQPAGPIHAALRFPFTLQVTIAATVISVNWWMGGHWYKPLTSDSILTKPWTLLTCTLPHVNPIHLLFNLTWWWQFGSLIERTWGLGKALAIFVFLAAVSGGAEYALLSGGVGLSGVVYGQCALLWVAQRRVAALGNAVTPQTLRLFGIWFIICIVLTVTKTAPIGNISHGAGALAGWAFGHAMTTRTNRREWTAGLILLTAIVLIASTVARPWINVAGLNDEDLRTASAAMSEGRYEDALKLLNEARKHTPQDPGILLNLGICYQHLEREDEALPLYKLVVTLSPEQRENVALSIAGILCAQADEAIDDGALQRGLELAIEALQWAPGNYEAERLITRAKSRLERTPDEGG